MEYRNIFGFLSEKAFQFSTAFCAEIAVSLHPKTIAGGVTSPYHGRLYILGHEGVGKTNLARNLSFRSFQPSHIPTEGADVFNVRPQFAKTNWRIEEHLSSNFDRSAVSTTAESTSVQFQALAVVIFGLLFNFLILALLEFLLGMPFFSLFLTIILMIPFRGGAKHNVKVPWLAYFVWVFPAVLDISMKVAREGNTSLLFLCLIGAGYSMMKRSREVYYSFFLLCSMYYLFVPAPENVSSEAITHCASCAFFGTVVLLVRIVLNKYGQRLQSLWWYFLAAFDSAVLIVFAFGLVVTKAPLGFQLFAGVLYSVRSLLCVFKTFRSSESFVGSFFRIPTNLNSPWQVVICGLLIGSLSFHGLLSAARGVGHLCYNNLVTVLCAILESLYWKEKVEPKPFRKRTLVSRLASVMYDAAQLENLKQPLMVFMDFAGQELYYMLHHLYLTPNSIYVVVFDFSKVCGDINRRIQHVNKLLFWLTSVVTHGREDASIFLVGTHRDSCQKEDREDAVRYIVNRLQSYHYNICRRSDQETGDLSFVFRIENSGERDDSEIVLLRQLILEELDRKRERDRKVPIRWLELEDKIVANSQQQQQQQQDDSALSLDLTSKIVTVVDLEQASGMTPEDFTGALKYLKNAGVVFHCSDSERLKDYVILDMDFLISAVRSLVSIPSPSRRPRGRLGRSWERLRTEGIADGNLLKHVWKDNLNHIGLVLEYLEHYGIMHNISSHSGNPMEYAMVAFLPEQRDLTLADAKRSSAVFDGGSIFVGFDKHFGSQHSLFNVLLTRAYRESQCVENFTPCWWNKGGIFVIEVPHFYGHQIVYKLEFYEDGFEISTTSALIRHIWNLLDDIRVTLFKSVQFWIGPCCPVCLPSGRDSKPPLDASERTTPPLNSLHVLPMAKSSSSENHDLRQFQSVLPRLYCGNREVDFDKYPCVREWLQPQQIPRVGSAILQELHERSQKASSMKGGDVVSDDMIHQIAAAIQNDWAFLGRHLSVEDEKIDRIRSRYRGDLVACATEVLFCWKRRNRDLAIGWELARALKQVDRVDLAEAHIQVF
ncbi:uncharacterized protein [Oscarella lobularis]|uniref:uncharacterized protein isoform X2 n=1 Tax=Oscarella lobularis TaxID=121494 RepID=UPI003313ECE5